MGENKKRLDKRSVIDRMVARRDGAELFNELIEWFYKSTDKRDTYFAQAKIFDEELSAAHDKILKSLESLWFKDFIEDYRIDHEEMLIELKQIVDSIGQLQGVALYEKIDELFDRLNDIQHDRKFDNLSCNGHVGSLLYAVSHYYLGNTVLGFTESSLNKAWQAIHNVIGIVNLNECILPDEVRDAILTVIKLMKDNKLCDGYYAYCIDRLNRGHGLNIQIVG